MLISKSATQAGAGSGLQQLVSLISESRHTSYIPVSLHVSVTETDKHPRVSMFVQLFLVQLVLCNNDSVLNEPDRLFKDICAFVSNMKSLLMLVV